jgi:predicted dehydrogenase
MSADVSLAVVGVGYWGPNLVRCAVEADDCVVKAICDFDVSALSKLTRRYPAIEGTQDLDGLLADDALDGVMIALPLITTSSGGVSWQESTSWSRSHWPRPPINAVS